MVGRIIPVNKVAEDDVSVTYEWGHPEVDKRARIIKRTGDVEPADGTTQEEALSIVAWISRVRQLNEMLGYPDEAPMYA